MFERTITGYMLQAPATWLSRITRAGIQVEIILLALGTWPDRFQLTPSQKRAHGQTSVPHNADNA